MDFIEKAKIRIEHWVEHSDHHIEDYTAFANQLEQEGKKESAEAIREMIELNIKSTECLKKALKGLE
ncbi:hypothetical protein ACFL6W_04660 [Thermodesulfobacteriota bacterium]